MALILPHLAGSQWESRQTHGAFAPFRAEQAGGRAGAEQSRKDLPDRIYPLQQFCQCSRLGFSKKPGEQDAPGTLSQVYPSSPP